MKLKVRRATESDASELCELLNEIIRAGGTTAMDIELSESNFSDHFLNGPDHICCHVALSENGSLSGFQWLGYNKNLPELWADIATFARINPKIKGVGSALFKATIRFAQASDIETINATIRADNTGGLAFYSKMGFVDYKINKQIPMKNGELIDRVCKRFDF